MIDFNGNVVDERQMSSFQPHVVWSTNGILSIGTGIDTVKINPHSTLKHSLPKVVNGGRAWIGRPREGQLSFVSPYTSTMTTVGEDSPDIPATSVELKSPEMDDSRLNKAAIDDDSSPTQRTLLIAAANTDANGNLFVIPTGYVITKGTPLNEFDSNGKLIARYRLGKPTAENGETDAIPHLVSIDKSS